MFEGVQWGIGAVGGGGEVFSQNLLKDTEWQTVYILMSRHIWIYTVCIGICFSVYLKARKPYILF